MRFGTGDKMGCVVMGCANGTLVQVPAAQRTTANGACFAVCKCGEKPIHLNPTFCNLLSV